jgi:hypothetical protein
VKLRLRFFDQEMSVWIGAGKDAEAQDIGDDERWFASAVHAVVGELIGRKPLRMQRAKAGFIAEKRASGHGHAAREQSFDWGVEPDDGNALRAQKIRRAGLRVSAATEREYGRFAQFECAPERGAELRGFEQTKGGFAVTFEKFGDAQAGSVFDAVIEIDETPCELAGELRADGALAGAHESGEGDYGDGKSASHAESLDECAM